jgi:transmembrane sensor
MTEADDEGRIAREAAEWLSRLNSRSVSTEELNAFYEWRRDPRNADAYTRGERLWHDARSLGDDRQIATAVREALERPRLAGAEGGGRLVARRTLLIGGGAIVAAAGAGWLLLGRADGYRTRVGEQLAVRLDDGSLMRLNTDSAAEVSFSAERRYIDLTRGQAFFEVARDPGRPFQVRAHDLDVVALGTRFDVYRPERQPPRVILVEGRVEVASEDGSWRRTLDQPGDAVIATGSQGPDITRLDAEAATSWTGGRLTFRGTPLAEAVAEVNRYSRRQIVLEAPDLRGLEVDGVFETGDPGSFVSALTTLFPLRAREDSTERIVLTRA